MKRCRLDPGGDLHEHPDGEWVPWKEAERLADTITQLHAECAKWLRQLNRRDRAPREKTVSVTLKGIEIEKQVVPTGIPWLDAPYGPAKVMDASASSFVGRIGDEVLIFRGKDGDQRMLTCGMWPDDCAPHENVLVEPLGPCEMVFKFE
jgi:hypothetical protein